MIPLCCNYLPHRQQNDMLELHKHKTEMHGYYCTLFTKFSNFNKNGWPFSIIVNMTIFSIITCKLVLGTEEVPMPSFCVGLVGLVLKGWDLCASWEGTSGIEILNTWGWWYWGNNNKLQNQTGTWSGLEGFFCLPFWVGWVPWIV